MFRDKFSIQHLLLLGFAFSLFFSCKTDPKNTSTTAAENKAFTVVTQLPAEPDMLLPCVSTSGYSSPITNQIFSNLINYDTRTLKPAPMLIKALPKTEEVKEGKYKGLLSSVFEIHEEAVWDNGTPVTGHDVDFTIKAILNPKVPAAPYRAIAMSFRDLIIDEKNPKKFSVIAENYFLSDLIFADIPVLPEYNYDSKGIMKNFTIAQLSDKDGVVKLAEKDTRLQEFATEFTSEKYAREKGFVQGCGPYELEEWISGQRIVLKKKKNWWGTKLAAKYPLLQANPETIIYRPIADMTTATTELKSGSVDLMSVISSQEFSGLKESAEAQSKLNFHEPLTLIIYYMGLNTQRPLLSDKRVRRAIAHVLDLDEIIQTVAYGYAKRVVGPFHPSRAYYADDLPLIDLNVEKAKSLLKEAGWEDTNGNGIVDKMVNGERKEMKLEYLATPNNGIGQQIGLLIQPVARQAGIEIEIVNKEFNLIRAAKAKRDFDMTIGGWSQDPSTDDPYQKWHTDSDSPSGGNQFGFGNERSDEIIEEIRTLVSEERRKELYKELQEIIYEEQPCIFLYAPSGRIAINKKFDYEPSVRKPWVFENEMKLKSNLASDN